MEHIQIAAGPAMFMPQFNLRSRREQPVRDVFNARQYEHWNTDAPQPVQNFPDINKQGPLNDQKPINTRTVARDYRQAQPYIPGGADGMGFGKNPYFEKYDVATDPRNVARELQAVVYEYNPPRDQETSNRLLDRNFQNLYVAESAVKKSYEEAIDIYAGMRPKLNDMKATFR